MFGRKKPVTGARDAAASTEAESPAPSSTGPHDRSSVPDVREYYTALGYSHIDLGSLVIGVPQGRDLGVRQTGRSEDQDEGVSPRELF